MRRFNGIRVALLEARMSREMSDLVRRYGGEPFCTPAVREALLPSGPDVAQFIDLLIDGSFSTVVFLTGVGASALFAAAERQGQLLQTLEALRNVTTVCRGPKPSAVLRQHNVPVVLSAGQPFTTTELLEVIAPITLAGTRVGLLHYGERDSVLADALAMRGADVHELCLYEWLMPEDLGPLKTLVGDLVAGKFDSVAFTSQIQCRHLFQIAATLGQTDALTEALNTRTVVAAVGPICATALQRLGVTPHVVPSNPKMAPMVSALADYFDSGANITKES
jgi:uroporphyrinogen-III synthase